MFRARPLAYSLLACAICACSARSQSSPASSNADAAGASGSVGCAQADGDAYTAGMQKPGVAGRFSFQLVSSSPAPPALDDNTFVLQVKDADGHPVAGDLAATLDMPKHGHASPTQPQISFDSASSTFTLDPMRLFMVGLWRLTFSFQPASGNSAAADSAVFKFCVD